MKSKNKKILLSSLVLTSVLVLNVATFSLAYALFEQNNTEPVSFGIQQSLSKNVTFYTAYTEGEWGSSSTVVIATNGHVTAGDIPSVSLSGYTFEGWVNEAPNASNIVSPITNEQVAAASVTNDIAYYPILKSNVKKAYVNANYYPIDEDVSLETNSIGETLIGYQYIGVDAIPNPSSSWHNSRSLHTASGIYKFTENDGAAIISRKIGFKPNSQWGQAWDNSSCGIGIHVWQGDNSVSIHMGNTSGEALFTYIPGDYSNFIIVRYSSNQNGFTWGNQSADLAFSNSWSGDTSYSKDSTILYMNYSSSYVTGWTSSDATWVEADPTAITEVPDNDFHNLNQYQFLHEPNLELYKTYANGSDLSAPKAMKLRFDDLASRGTYYVQIAESESGLSSAEIHETTNTYYDLWNAKLGTTYYYRAATSEGGLASAEIRNITSTDLAPRVLNVPNVLNFRDIGGWDTYLVPGQKIKQGLYFRCAQLNAAGGSTTSKLDNEGKGLAAIKELGIKVDIDLRDSVPSQSPANTVEWPVAIIDAHIPSGSENVRWEGGTYSGTNIANQYKTVFETMANCDNAPALLHCTYGADRTGIATFFLESLLGMSIKDMTRDYVWTQFTQGRNIKLTENDAEFPKWISKTQALSGNTFADKMKNHLMSFGISEHTLEHIREIFIDGYVAQA